ncbi:MAG: AAA family ATPase, partial [Thermoproteota archaeon]
HRLAEIFKTAESYGKCVLFIDEIDALAVRREDIHEESRRVLSVLLTRLDGIKTKPGILTIGATNRIEDLDPAVRRRFDEEIYFRLPNLKDRKEIFRLYAKHLPEEELEELANKTEGFSGSDIERIARSVERAFGKKIIEEKISGLPSVEMYMQAIEEEKVRKTSKNSHF